MSIFMPPYKSPSEKKPDKFVWVYFETDGDAGWYDVEIFDTEEEAERHKKKVGSAYGDTTKKKVR